MFSLEDNIIDTGFYILSFIYPYFLNSKDIEEPLLDSIEIDDDWVKVQVKNPFIEL